MICKTCGTYYSCSCGGATSTLCKVCIKTAASSSTTDVCLTQATYTKTKTALSLQTPSGCDVYWSVKGLTEPVSATQTISIIGYPSGSYVLVLVSGKSTREIKIII